jgi:hypothetical protein
MSMTSRVDMCGLARVCPLCAKSGHLVHYKERSLFVLSSTKKKLPQKIFQIRPSARRRWRRS